MSFSPESILFFDGSQNCKAFLVHKQSLDQDDFIEIDVPLKFNLRPNPIENNSTNAFFIQISPPQQNAEETLSADFTSLYGLVISIFGTNNVGNGTYVVTHRFFGQESLLSKDYFAILSESRDKLQGCLLPNLNDISRLVVKIDIENTKTVEVLLEEGGVLKTCLKVPNLLRYVNTKQMILSFKGMTNQLNSLRLDINGITVKEKKHSFDIDDNLDISHVLVEEIFEKVNTFTEKFNENKEKLGTIYSMQQEVSASANKLEMYASDLFKGTRKFQEFMIENLASKKIFGVEHMPKMRKVQNKIDELNEIQKAIFDRFLSIQKSLNSKQLFKRTFQRMLKLQNVMEKASAFMSNSKFEQIIKESEKMASIASQKDVKSVLQTFKDLKDDLSHEATFGLGMALFSIGLFALVLFVFLIIRKIIAVEKSHFS